MYKIIKFSLLHTSLAICALMQPQVFISQLYANQDYFTRGLESKKNGDWQGALKIWWSAHYKLDKLGKVDPRIGIAFIELATEMKAQEYYNNASEIYLWGFSKPGMFEFPKTVKEEIDRLSPLLGEEAQATWQQTAKQQSLEICFYLRKFWLEKDSRPATRGNERLIEHWVRIAYARKHFGKNRNGVYGCDARGTIYVKYGQPGKKHKGMLGSSSASELELMRWVANLRARRKIKTEDLNPEYEMWIYNTLGTEEHSVFLFANRFGTGSFGLVEGVESLIPKKQSIYQIMYYAELSLFNPIFRERYFELEEIWNHQQMARERGQPSGHYIRVLRTIFYANKNNDRINPNYKFANLDNSDYEDLFGKIDIITHNIRLLDQKNQPRLAIIALSYPKFKPRKVSARSKKSLEIPDYHLKHALIIRNESLEEIDRVEDLVPKGMDNISVFMVNHLQANNHYSVSSEAIGYYADSIAEGDRFSEEKNRLYAIGKTFFKTRKPLAANLDSLELSDWVLGVNFPSENYKSHLPFPLVPAKQVSKQDPLQVYCEIYHLQKDAGGTAHYTLEFGISKLDKKGRLDNKAEKVSVVYNFDVPDQTRKEHISIDLKKLKPGLYEFFGKVTDKVSGQEKTRKKKITILK
ncbi:GWxTD domain-containing protein [candidate division KSB1 bacterium]|nr:GWxTD domain-containing protein [candidate division KSB1 bacterium]